MNKDEIAKVLIIAMGIDARLNAADQNAFVAKVEGWNLALSKSMPFEFAREALGKHYASSTDSVMPANLNALWRAERDRTSQIAQISEITASRDENSVKGMPDDVRAKFAEMRLLKP